jgi:hypothetical protein
MLSNCIPDLRSVKHALQRTSSARSRGLHSSLVGEHSRIRSEQAHLRQADLKIKHRHFGKTPMECLLWRRRRLLIWPPYDGRVRASPSGAVVCSQAPLLYHFRVEAALGAHAKAGQLLGRSHDYDRDVAKHGLRPRLLR